MTVLPGGRMLVTEKGGAVVLVWARGRRLGEVAGVPLVRARGQGGLGDVVLHPGFARNGLAYLSLVERDSADRRLSGAVVVRGRLSLTETGASVTARICPGRPDGTAWEEVGLLWGWQSMGRTPSQSDESDQGDCADRNLCPFAGKGSNRAATFCVGHNNPPPRPRATAQPLPYHLDGEPSTSTCRHSRSAVSTAGRA